MTRTDYEQKIYTVSELTREIKDLLEEEFPLVWLEGEISNFRVPPSGHYYFSLKDANSQIRAVFFRSGQGALTFLPEDGLQVLCLGRLSVYPGRGDYQIIIERMELKGWGALQRAFEQLKERLLKEGLFDEARKKPIPVLPRVVAVVTSPSGAAIRDFLRILYRRFRNIQVYIVPVLVQGERASYEIAEALRDLNRADLGIEVIILARGGGSIEDLWAFNEERVARGIAASAIPVISAIGHEVDFTIADFVADLRVSTPSAAAELVIQPQQEWEGKIEDLQGRLIQEIGQEITFRQEKLFHLHKRLGDPRRRWIDLALRLDDTLIRLRLALEGTFRKKRDGYLLGRERLLGRNPLGQVRSLEQALEFGRIKLMTLIRERINRSEMNLKAQAKTLLALSPWGILDRGYALARTLPAMELIRDVAGLPVGQAIRVTLASGEMDCRVEEIHKKEDPSLVEGTF